MKINYFWAIYLIIFDSKDEGESSEEESDGEGSGDEEKEGMD